MLKSLMAACAPAVLAGVVLAGSAGVANAATAENSIAEVLHQVPHNADGTVSRDAFVAYMEAAFDRLDPAHSGKIDPSKVVRAQRCVRMFGPRYVPGASLTGC